MFDLVTIIDWLVRIDSMLFFRFWFQKVYRNFKTKTEIKLKIKNSKIIFWIPKLPLLNAINSQLTFPAAVASWSNPLSHSQLSCSVPKPQTRIRSNQNASEIRDIAATYGNHGYPLGSVVRLHRPDRPRNSGPPLQLPPTASPPPEAPNPNPPLSDDGIRPRPPHLLHGGVRHRLRRDRGASGHRVDPGPLDRVGPPRGVSAGPGQRAVHNRRAIFRVHVRARWCGNCADGFGLGSQSG